jgi:REP element-mobilizing transposase RayT
MTRLRLPNVDYAEASLVFFVTIRAHPRTAPFTDPTLAQEVIQSLAWLREKRRMRLHAYCLMPDHLHLLLQLGESSPSLGWIIRAMTSFTTRRYWALGAKGVLWQERFHERIMREAGDGRYRSALPASHSHGASPSM